MGGENLLGVPTLLSGIVGKGQRMRGQAPRVGKVSWRFRIGPKPFLQARGKPASHLQALDCELKASQTSRTPGRGQHMRRQAPRVKKASWRIRIGPKPFLQTCSKPASHLQALKRVRRPELRAPQLGESP